MGEDGEHMVENELMEVATPEVIFQSDYTSSSSLKIICRTTLQTSRTPFDIKAVTQLVILSHSFCGKTGKLLIFGVPNKMLVIIKL